MTEEEMRRMLLGRVTALEVVIKAVIAMQLVSMAKTPKRLPKMVELADGVSRQLQDAIDEMALEQRRKSGNSLSLSEQEALKETVARCFGHPASDLEKIAAEYLKAMASPSDAKH